VDLFSYFRGPFFLHPVNGPYFLVDVVSVDLFSEHLADHIGDGFYRSKDPTNSVKALKEEKSYGPGFNPIRSTPLC